MIMLGYGLYNYEHERIDFRMEVPGFYIQIQFESNPPSVSTAVVERRTLMRKPFSKKPSRFLLPRSPVESCNTLQPEG